MGAYLARTFHRKADGTKLFYYILRENYWDRQQKRQRQRYLAYIGRKPMIPEAKARALAKKLRISVKELKAVRGLKIAGEAPQESSQKAKRRRPWERI